MKSTAILILLSTTMVLAQQQPAAPVKPATAPATTTTPWVPTDPAAVTAPAAAAPPVVQAYTPENTDPEKDTNDPTLLRAQVMILERTQEVYRAHLSPLADFQVYEKCQQQIAAKKQRLGQVLQANQTAVQQSAQSALVKQKMDEAAKTRKSDEKLKAPGTEEVKKP